MPLPRLRIELRLLELQASALPLSYLGGIITSH